MEAAGLKAGLQQVQVSEGQGGLQETTRGEGRGNGDQAVPAGGGGKSNPTAKHRWHTHMPVDVCMPWHGLQDGRACVRGAEAAGASPQRVPTAFFGIVMHVNMHSHEVENAICITV